MRDFYKEIYGLVRKIPKGKITTYGAVAKKLNISPRVVGHALHINPDGINIPCHRVVNRQGRLAMRFAFGGENEQKRRLEKEGIKFESNRVNIKRYLFEF